MPFVHDPAGDHQPTCGCAAKAIEQVLAEPDCTVVVCHSCRAVPLRKLLAGAEGEVVPLDEAAQQAVWRALRISPRGPIAERLRRALGCTTFPADRIASARLLSDTGFVGELDRCIRGRDASERLLALEFASRLEPMPAGLSSAIVHALENPIDRSALSDETALALAAISVVAEEAIGARDTIAALLGSIKRNKSARGVLIRTRATLVLTRMDAAIRENEAALLRRCDELKAAVLRGAHEEAEALIAGHAAGDSAGYGDVSRGALCEAAGDALAPGHRDAARWLYDKAIERYARHAAGATSGSEGLACMADVNRMKAKRRDM